MKLELFQLCAEAILDIARLEDGDDDDGAPLISSYVRCLAGLKRQDAKVLSFAKQSRALEKAVVAKWLPVAPFVNRSAIGRQKRQIILSRLTCQHIMCLSQDSEGSKGMEDVLKEMDERPHAFERAKERAIEQEQEIFQSCHTNQSYTSKSMNVTAIDWYKPYIQRANNEHLSQPMQEDKKGSSPVDGRHATKGSKRKSSVLLDSDIDWDQGVTDSDVQRNRTAKRVKKIVLEELDQTFGNTLAPEFKVTLINEILSDSEGKMGALENSEDSKIRAIIRPFVHQATVSHRILFTG